MSSKNLILKILIISSGLALGFENTVHALQWKGRKQSDNVVDLRGNFPLDLAKQRLESIILEIEFRSQNPIAIEIMNKCEGGRKALELFRAESQKFRNHHRSIFKSTAKDRDLSLSDEQLDKISGATNSCAKESSDLLMQDLQRIRLKALENRKIFQKALQVTRRNYERDKEKVAKSRESFQGCNSGLPSKGIFGAAKSRARPGSHEESVLLSNIVNMEQEFVDAYDELIRVLDQKIAHIDSSVEMLKSVGC
jgi:hypothetical protein